MPLTYSIAYGIIGGLMVTFVIKGADASIYLSKKALMLCNTQEEEPTINTQPDLSEVSDDNQVELAIIE